MLNRSLGTSWGEGAGQGTIGRGGALVTESGYTLAVKDLQGLGFLQISLALEVVWSLGLF